MYITFTPQLDIIDERSTLSHNNHRKYIDKESCRMYWCRHNVRQYENLLYPNFGQYVYNRLARVTSRFLDEWHEKITIIITEKILAIAKSILTSYFSKYHPSSVQMNLNKNFGERLREDCRIAANTAKCSERRIGCDNHKVKAYTIKRIIHCVGEGLRNLVYKLCPHQRPPRCPLICFTKI